MIPLIIIFGLGSRQKQVGEGQFFCPRCGTQRRYIQKQANRYFTVFFLPVVPLGKIGDFVECQTCHAAFETTVLNFKVPPPPPPSLAQLLNTAKERLERGTPIEYILRDMTAAGLDRDIAHSTVTNFVKDGRKTCSSCGLSYHPVAKTCQGCGKLLS